MSVLTGIVCTLVSWHVLKKNLVRPDQDTIVNRPKINYNDYAYGTHCDIDGPFNTNDLSIISALNVSIERYEPSASTLYDPITEYIEWYVFKDTGIYGGTYRWHIDGQVVNKHSVVLSFYDNDCTYLFTAKVPHGEAYYWHVDDYIHEWYTYNFDFTEWIYYEDGVRIPLTDIEGKGTPFIPTHDTIIHAAYGDNPNPQCEQHTKIPTPSQTNPYHRPRTRTLEFTTSEYFKHSKMFTSSDHFMSTLGFTTSDHFESTTTFTHSMLFVESEPLTSSQVFTFSNSDCFISTLGFTYSEEFTSTSYFMSTSGFSDSEPFMSTRTFAASECFESALWFSDSEPFMHSMWFSDSDCFECSEEFTHSILFDDSYYFELTLEFSSSEYFMSTLEFTHSVIFSDSDSFECSTEFSSSEPFECSSEFSHSMRFSSSETFMSTSEYSDSAVVTVPPDIITPIVVSIGVVTAAAATTAAVVIKRKREFPDLEFSSKNNAPRAYKLDNLESGFL